MWGDVFLVFIGVGAGMSGQLFMSWLNHKRELEKLAYTEKYRVYNSIMESIHIARQNINNQIFIYNHETQDVECVVDKDEIETIISTAVHLIKKQLSGNLVIISPEVKESTFSVIKAIEKNSAKTRDATTKLTQQMKKELKLN